MVGGSLTTISGGFEGFKALIIVEEWVASLFARNGGKQSKQLSSSLGVVVGTVMPQPFYDLNYVVGCNFRMNREEIRERWDN